MNIVVFEDSQTDRLYPASATKAVWDIFCGSKKISERIESEVLRFTGSRDRFFYYTRPVLADYYKSEKTEMRVNDPAPLEKGSETFFINAALKNIVSPSGLEKGEVIVNDENVPLAALLEINQEILPDNISDGIINNSLKTTKTEGGFSKYNYLWDIVNDNPRLIENDSVLYKKEIRTGYLCTIGNPEKLLIAEHVGIEPYTFFNTTKGPVIIEPGCTIHAFSRIEGPAFIGSDSVIQGAAIRSGTSIGRNCRIGGEIEQSIFQSRSNKYHEGFIGHSFIGEWVNMGALTTNSDLKNNYSPVSVYIPGEGNVNTGQMKVGCFLGDYTKTSIGTLINTGTVTGPGAMLVHAGKMTPAHIPPFSWYINNSISNKDWLNEFILSSSKMLSRRDKTMSTQLETMLKNIYEQTGEMRRRQ